MRILHTYKAYRPDVEGGIPEVISSLAFDAPSDLQSSVLVARSRGLPLKYAVDHVPITASRSFGTLFSMPIAPAYPLKLALRSHEVDLIAHHAPFPLTDLAVVGLAARAALVVHWHAEIVGRSLLKSLLTVPIGHALGRADKIIVSHPTMIEQSEFLRPHREKCVVVPYGVDVGYWGQLSGPQQITADQLRKQFPRLIVAVGRLVAYKGYSVLLRALQGLDAQLVIIGEGPLLSELKVRAQDLGIAERVVFAGRLERAQIKQYVHASRVMALASVTSAEAFGLVQIEAMAAGRPVVNTDLPTAVPFVARNGIEGLTVGRDNADAMRRALRGLLDDEALATRLGEAGRLRAHSEYGLDLFRERNFAVYKTALEHRHAILERRT